VRSWLSSFRTTGNGWLKASSHDWRVEGVGGIAAMLTGVRLVSGYIVDRGLQVGPRRLIYSSIFEFKIGGVNIDIDM
jgi:hypothetical protein